MLQKYGRPNEATPAQWQSEYKDYTAPVRGTTVQMAGEEVTAVAGLPPTSGTPNGVSTSTVAVEVKVDNEEKKRKRHEGETPEERAERKRRKKEKKEKKAAKRASKGSAGTVKAGESEASD